MKSLLSCLLLGVGGVLSPILAAPPTARPWNQDVIYFALTDRFYDGDPDNDVPAGSDPALYDRTQTQIDRYHGGDLRGLELALDAGYFNALGVTALWITPPVRNVWYSAFDLNGAPKTGYHGYWAQDFLDIDPHLVSRHSLDGKREYPDTRDGRMQHYKDFVALAHRHGLKVVQDIVCNHAGPVFYYDANGNGQFDREQESEWIQPFKKEGFYPNAHWADTPRWDQHRAEPFGPVTVLGREVKTSGAVGNLESYGRKGMSPDSLGKSDGEEVLCDFFGLRDFWTSPSGPRFEELVNDFVEIYAFYVEEIGVDGFRIDTVKHVHHEFWDVFTERLRRRLGPERVKNLLLFGEVYGGSAAQAGAYTYRLDFPPDRQPCLDSVLNFPFCYAVRSYLRNADKPFGSAKEVPAAVENPTVNSPSGPAHPAFNPAKGADGLDSAQKLVNFVENHDGLNRFRVAGISERRNLLANALLLLSPGIPCLYYGTEAALDDPLGKPDADTETGRLTFVRSGGQPAFAKIEQQKSFRGIAALTHLRNTLPALTSGAMLPLQPESPSPNAAAGWFAFARQTPAEADLVVVACRASSETPSDSQPTCTLKLVAPDGKPLVKPGDRLERLPITGLDSPTPADPQPPIRWTDGVPTLEIHLEGDSVAVFHRTR